MDREHISLAQRPRKPYSIIRSFCSRRFSMIFVSYLRYFVFFVSYLNLKNLNIFKDDLLKLQENILIYWTVQGIFNVLDNILWKGPDYFCVKFILLSLLFSFLTSDKANLKNKDEENSANLNDATSHLQSILTTVDYTQYTTSCSVQASSQRKIN